MKRAGAAATLGVLFAVQIALLVLPAPFVLPVFLPGVLLAAVVARCHPGRLLWRIRGLVIILCAVLVARLLSHPSWDTVYQWGVYAARLALAVVVVVAVVHRWGAPVVYRGVAVVCAPLPRAVATPLVDVVSSAVFLIPRLMAVLREVRGTSTVRLARAPGGVVQRFAAVGRCTVIAVAQMPRPRGEAMVVRGLVGSREDR